MAARITWRVEEWKRSMAPAIDVGLFAAADAFADGAKELLNGPSPSSPGSPPGHDTGHLSRSIQAASPQALGTPGRAAFGTAVEYGRHLEYGAIIRPKTKKYLAVPVNRRLFGALQRKANTAAGAKGFTFSVRNIPGLKYIPPGRKSNPNYGGKLVLAKSVKTHVRGYKRSSKTEPVGTTAFILLKQVRVQPRPWILRTATIYRVDAERAFIDAASKRMRASGVVK